MPLRSVRMTGSLMTLTWLIQPFRLLLLALSCEGGDRLTHTIC
jgi:hypothetical protein